MSNLEEKLIERNYPKELILENFEKAKKKNRRDLIFNPRKTKGKDEKIRLIFTHNAGNPPLHQWTREAKKQLVRNDKAKKMGDCIQISSRQPKNL